MSFPFPDFERLHAVGRVKFIEIDGKVFAYNVKDSYLVRVNNSEAFSSEVVKTPKNPVKTLILHTTYECNLRCKHCYINAGVKRSDEMDSKELSRIVREFGELGGLGVDLSGGEALLKEGIEEVIQEARNQKLRTVVLSNGADINLEQLKRVAPPIDGIAIGLDGLYESNDEIRGDGSFDRTIKGLEKIAEEGVELSFTTLITPESIPQLLDFPEFVSKYGGKHWSLVMPRPSGRFSGEEEKIDSIYKLWEEAKNNGLLKELQEKSHQYKVSVILDHILVPGAKKRVEETSTDFIYQIYNRGRACWDNSLTIMPNGDVKCCLFFDGQVYGNVQNKSLRSVYESEGRERALGEFKRYPIDKCPFVEKHVLKDFERKLV